jgi:hypothetical protein
MNNENEYMQTGNKIEVRENELIQFIFEQLSKYDHDIHNMSPEESSYSPYSHPIVYQVGDGRMIEIPKAIQAKAIQIYMEQKNNNQHKQNDEEIQYMPVKVEPDNTMLYVVVGFILLLVGYLLFNSNKPNFGLY